MKFRLNFAVLAAVLLPLALPAQSPKPKQPTQQAQQGTKAQTANEYGAWTLSQKTNPVTDVKEIVFTLRSQNREGGVLLAEPMVLIVRLTGRRRLLELYISTGFVVDSNEYGRVSCMVRYDKEVAREENFSISSDHAAVFFQGAEKALLKLSSSKTFAIQIPKFQSGDRHGIFALNGTASVKARIEAELGRKLWDLVPPLDPIPPVPASYAHLLAMKTDGSPLAWRHDGNRQLGDGATASR